MDAAPGAEAQVTRALCELFQHRRDQDLAAARLRGDASGQIHGGAEEVLTLLDDLTGMEADANPDRLLGVLGGVAGEGALHGDGAEEGAAGTGERHHEAIPL